MDLQPPTSPPAPPTQPIQQVNEGPVSTTSITPIPALVPSEICAPPSSITSSENVETQTPALPVVFALTFDLHHDRKIDLKQEYNNFVEAKRNNPAKATQKDNAKLLSVKDKVFVIL